MTYKLNLKLSSDDHEYIRNYALNNYRRNFIHNGSGRKYCNLLKISTERDNALRLCEEKMSEFGIKNWKEEPQFGVFIGVNFIGGFVHKHVDFAKESEYHLRLNFMIQKPNRGGIPIVNGTEVLVDEGESWINLANVWEHSSTPATGTKERIVLSIGSLVSVDEEVLSCYK